jgi:signal transduction histidine kinase
MARGHEEEGTSRARVLIIDDNVELVGALHAVLMTSELRSISGQKTAIEVVTASCGEDGLAVARTKGFDVAIVDVKLPDVSGVDLIAGLRKASTFGEVVLITGFASMDSAIRALRSGAFAFVPKSFRPEELLSTVEQALTKARLAREREELERRYRALVELTDVLVVGVDFAGAVVLFNRKASVLAMVEPSGALGRSFTDSWIPKEDRQHMVDAMTHARLGRTQEIETGFADMSAELASGAALVSTRQLGAGPARRRVRWHLSAAGDPGDGGALVYGIGIDITERHALEKRAADAEAISAMGTLALNLAHEIRNPLNAALLQLHLLGRHVAKVDVDPCVRETLQHKAQIVGDEIGRLSRLLTEFLELARPRAPAQTWVHLASLVHAVLDLEQVAAAANGVVMERDVADCAVLGDPEQLEQVVLNLVMNGLEAMKQGGTLRLEVAPSGASVHVVVVDTGAGIDAAVLSQVFDPFFTTKEAGTGLGLSIVRKIVEQHGGEVQIESRRGVGTRVTVILPKGR